MNEEIMNKTDEVLSILLDQMKDRQDKTDPGMTVLVQNCATLYKLRQTDTDREAKYDDLRDKLAYDNGRLDEEIRLKEHNLSLEQDKFDLEKEKFEFDKQRYADGLETDHRKLDEELRLKDHNISLEEDKFAFDKEKFEFEKQRYADGAEADRQKSKSLVNEQRIRMGLAAAGMAFKVWLSSCLMYFDTTGHVVGSFLGKKTLGSWIDRDEKL